MSTPSSGSSLPVESATAAQRTRCDGRRTVVRLRFVNGHITRDSARTWARSLATDLWGPINDEASARLSSGRDVLARAGAYVWWFSCCAACHQGYRGRIAIAELVTATPEVRTAIARRSPDLAGVVRMRPMLADGVDKITAALTTTAEVRRMVLATTALGAREASLAEPEAVL